VRYLLRLILGLAVLLLLVMAGPVYAQTGQSAVDFTPFLPAALTLLLPIGMLLLISSAMPEDRAPAATVHLLVVWGVATLAYFAVGFAFQFGGIAQVSPNPDFSGLYWEWYPLDRSVDVDVARLWGVVALRGWFLSGEAATPGAQRLFLSHVALVGVAAIIPAGALLYRQRGGAALATGLLVGGLIYPISGNWLWGGGWLSHLGTSLGLGHGLVDFGGASVIFLAGSAVTLIALMMLNYAAPAPQMDAETGEVVVTTGAERLTVYEESPTDTETGAEKPPLPVAPMPPAHLPILSMLGGGLLLLGWFGLVTGIHIPTALNISPALAATNGLLAALAAALTAAGYSWFTTWKFDPLMTARGLVAGLIVAMAGAPFAPTWLFVVAGLITGALLPPLIYLLDRRLPLADGLGVLTTYGLSAIGSLLLVAFFADGSAGQGWNGVGLTDYLGVTGQGVTGLVVAAGFGSDWPGQLQAQLLGLGVILVWALLLGLLLFQTINAVIEAWARTGWELAVGRVPPAAVAANKQSLAEPPEGTSDPQLTARGQAEGFTGDL